MATSDEQRTQKLYGCSLGYKNSLPKDVVKKYTAHRHRAKYRNIGWEFTLPEWWKAWEPYWSNRGPGLNNYVMARKGDVGPYSVSTIRIKTSAENIAEYYENFRGGDCYESLWESVKNSVELNLESAMAMRIFYSDKNLLKQACIEKNLPYKRIKARFTDSFDKLWAVFAIVLIDWMYLWKAAEAERIALSNIVKGVVEK